VLELAGCTNDDLRSGFLEQLRHDNPCAPGQHRRYAAAGAGSRAIGQGRRSGDTGDTGDTELEVCPSPGISTPQVGAEASAVAFAPRLGGSVVEMIVNLYDCDNCKYRYDPANHAGLDLDDQPGDFECPNCQAGKDHFHVYAPPTDDIAPPLENGEERAQGADPSGPRLMYTKASSPTLQSLYLQFTKKRLDTQPDFQRYEVWSVQKKSALIESILFDLPVPQVFVAQELDNSEVVVDGQQRMMAIFRYMQDEYGLKGLPSSSIEGKKFSQLSMDLQEKIENYELRVVKILKESDPDVRFQLFRRLNEGSISLNDQELRNCVWRGAYNEFVKELAEDSAWRKLINLKKRHPRMVDVELVLRYMAFRDQQYMAHPDKKTGLFLDKQMSIGGDYKDKDYKAARKDFKTAVELAQTVFGDRACRRFVSGTEDSKAGSWDSKINRALMDVQLWGFSRYSKGLFVKNADAVREAAIQLMASAEFSDLISHTISEFKRLERRFDLWKQMLDSVLGGEDLGPRLFTRKEKEAAFTADPTCAICSQQIQSIDDAHLDHKEPYSKGGPTTAANAALTHRYCNLVKSNASD
jgi:rubredoxin